ncbi:high potential iron-sulfur protein [Caballeronia arationis]|uniref:High-potential iron-sulfur protein n=1 Tax=Caballeronia arationis TaxID=1777142 RepID=A0A7Z7I1I0_9BURK|nr:high-potential iron-sulfur protein [Caballeronia arationis]SAL04653.1 high potential iron-sulfur protein [Caballeronia arationis]SOE50011.1 High potential iron-sulfur protein [Caballeronia arationis]
MQLSRRHFMVLAASLASSVALSSKASADTPAVSETDPTAQSLGYKADATHVDKVKYSKYQPGQACATCQLYQGKPGDPAGPCPIFAGKQVEAKGWCSAYVKKA